MLRNFLLITLRSMTKNKLFIIINIFGLGVALACCIIAWFVFEFDQSFDAMHLKGGTIYRASSRREFNNTIEKYGTVPLPLGSVVAGNNTDIERYARYTHSWSNLKREDDIFESRMSYVDPAFFEMFTFDFISGSPGEIKDKSAIFINEKLAVRLFGDPREALGKMMTQVYGTETKEVRVAAVFRDQPLNSSFHWQQSYMNFDNVRDEFKDFREDDWARETTLFLQVSDASKLAGIRRQLQPYTEHNNKVREDFIVREFVLDPFVSMARDDRADEEVRSRTWDAPPIAAVIGVSVMAILILLIACFNLTNTAMSISARRLKEIGIRKVMGSVRKQLVLQFLSETLFISFIALLLALLVAEFLAMGWNGMWEYMRIQTHYLDNPKILLFLGAILLFTALLAGSYPAFYISRFEPISILKGKLKFGGSNYFSWVLLSAQFAISLIAIVSAIAFWQNARYQENYDLGFNVRGSVITWLNNKDEVEAYRTAIEASPLVLSASGCNSGIFSNRSHLPIRHESKEVEVDIINVGDDYLRTMNLTLEEGRDFRKDSETDRKESVIISRRLARLYGWDKPLGKEIIFHDTVRLYVVGVVRDVYTMGLWRELEPLMIRYIGPDDYSQLVVSAPAANVSELHQFMAKEWKEMFPYRLFNGQMLGENFKEVSNVNANILKMFLFLGFIAMLLSATGLFTLVSLNILKRMKEIGVRKVLGASVGNITRIINTEFFIILVVASLLGSAAGYFAVDALMGSIWRYYQASTPATFVGAITVMVLISVGSIAWKVITAASMNPVSTLRDE